MKQSTPYHSITRLFQVMPATATPRRSARLAQPSVKTPVRTPAPVTVPVAPKKAPRSKPILMSEVVVEIHPHEELLDATSDAATTKDKLPDLQEVYNQELKNMHVYVVANSNCLDSLLSGSLLDGNSLLGGSLLDGYNL